MSGRVGKQLDSSHANEGLGLLVCNVPINFYTPPVKLENCTYLETQESLTRTWAVMLNLSEMGKRSRFVGTIPWVNIVCEPAWNMRYPVDGAGKVLLEQRLHLPICLQREGKRKCGLEQLPEPLPSLERAVHAADVMQWQPTTSLLLAVQFSCMQDLHASFGNKNKSYIKKQKQLGNSFCSSLESF